MAPPVNLKKAGTVLGGTSTKAFSTFGCVPSPPEALSFANQKHWECATIKHMSFNTGKCCTSVASKAFSTMQDDFSKLTG
jgi:hypothetical protein